MRGQHHHQVSVVGAEGFHPSATEAIVETGWCDAFIRLNVRAVHMVWSRMAGFVP